MNLCCLWFYGCLICSLFAYCLLVFCVYCCALVGLFILLMVLCGDDLIVVCFERSRFIVTIRVGLIGLS